MPKKQYKCQMCLKNVSNKDTKLCISCQYGWSKDNNAMELDNVEYECIRPLDKKEIKRRLSLIKIKYI